MSTDRKTANDASPGSPEKLNNYWHFRRDTDTALIFIHGIFSDSQSCWRANNGVYWPDLVGMDPRLGQPSIYLAGFYTAVDAGALDVRSCAREIMDALERTGSDGAPPALKYPRLVFVCHSTGGIVARYLIERNQYKFVSKAVGLALIASPSLGSKWADIGSFLAKYHGNRLALQLRSKDSSVEDINDRFYDLVYKRDDRMPGLFGMEACETEFIWRRSMPALLRYVIPNQWRVVGRQSARQFFSAVKELAGTDHFTAVKPTGIEHPAHQFLVTFFEEFRKVVTPRRQGADEQQRVAVSAVTAESAPSVVAASDIAKAPPPKVSVSLGFADIPQSPMALAQASQRPQLKDLFEIITNPDEVKNALYMTEAGQGIAAYDAPYINAREDMADVQAAIELALREARGRLMIYGARGIGKTREVVELARNACAAKWTVLVARPEGTIPLGQPQALPPQLADARLLVVIDNVHTRISGSAGQLDAPYLERLQGFLEWLERLVPGNVRVLLTASNEARFRRHVGVDEGAVRWRGFGVFRLPMLTSEALRTLLTNLAALAQVQISPQDVSKLIDNSDHKPETVFINVDLARRLGQPLGTHNWRPTEGESWKLRFASARAEHPGAAEVCSALQLLCKVGLPARLPYVVSVARRMGSTDPAAAAALIGDGLLGQRHGVLSPFSAEQLQEMAGDGPPAATLAKFREAIESEIYATRNISLAEDIRSLALALSRIGDMNAADEVAARAAAGAPAEAWPYMLQAGLRFMRLDWPGTLAHLSKALQTAPKDTDALFLKGATLNIQAEFAAALADLTRAVELGRDDAVVHAQIGTSHFHIQQWKEAAAAFTTAIERGENSAALYLTRGVARMQAGDFAAAELDLSAAIERRIDFAVIASELRALGSRELADKVVTPPHQESAALLAMRGFLRLRLGQHAGAEEDLTKAITSGPDESYAALFEQMRESPLPMIRQSVMEPAKHAFAKDMLHFMRGVARSNLNRPQDAAADFDAVLATGRADGEVYAERGWARLAMEQHADAEADARAALKSGRNDARTYALAGLALLGQQRPVEAEADFDSAVALEPENANLFVWRGLARTHQQKLKDAEADFSRAFTLNASPKAAFLRGCVRLDQQMFAEAEADFTTSAQLGHQPLELFRLRGSARVAQEKIPEAAEDIDAAYAGGDRDVLVYSTRGYVRLRQQRIAEAEADFTEAIRQGRNDAWVYAHRGVTRQSLERFADAERDYDAVLALGTVDADLFSRRGTMRSKQGKAAAAAEDYRAAIAAGRDDGYAHFCLARESANLGLYREAEISYREALARDPNPHFRAARGATRLVIGAFGPSEEDLDAAIPHMRADADVRFIRALARLGSGKLKSAMEDIQACLLISPERYDFVGMRALVRIRLGELRNAEKDCALLEVTSPDKEGPGCRGTLLLARGDFAAALTAFERAAQADGEWRFWVGLTSLLLGRVEDARRMYSECLAQSGHPADGLIHAANLEFVLRGHRKKLTSAIRDAAGLIKAELLTPAEKARATAGI